MTGQSAAASVEAQAASAETALAEDFAAIQPAGFLLVLSPDWIVTRASENVHKFLGESHVTIVDQPLSKFVKAQELHDLRNLFSRLSSSGGSFCAYRVRLTEDQRWFDLVFQASHGRVLLEGVDTAAQGLGEAIGSVGGLVAAMPERGSSLLESGARRMRALTGFDRAVVTVGGRQAHSSRGKFVLDELPERRCLRSRVIADVQSDPVPVYPRKARHRSVEQAVLAAASPDERALLRSHGIAATMSIPIQRGTETIGWFHCDNRTPRPCDLETHAAAGLFAQMFAMRLEIEQLTRA